VPEGRSSTIVNEKLFSNDYLWHRLAERSDWKRMAADREGQSVVAGIYRDAGHLLETANEMQVRIEVIDPILRVLDHHFLPEETLSTDRTTTHSSAM